LHSIHENKAADKFLAMEKGEKKIKRGKKKVTEGFSIV